MAKPEFTVKQMRAICRKRGVRGYSKWKKNKLTKRCGAKVLDRCTARRVKYRCPARTKGGKTRRRHAKLKRRCLMQGIIWYPAQPIKTARVYDAPTGTYRPITREELGRPAGLPESYTLALSGYRGVMKHGLQEHITKVGTLPPTNLEIMHTIRDFYKKKISPMHLLSVYEYEHESKWPRNVVGPMRPWPDGGAPRSLFVKNFGFTGLRPLAQKKQQYPIFQVQLLPSKYA